MYIASLQFYKQMYNKYIINRLLLWDGGEPACVIFVFSSFTSVTIWRGMSRGSPLRRVLILLCAAAAEIHPAHVVPVCYPAVGTRCTASVVCCGVSAHRTWEEKWGSDQKWGGGGGTEQEGNKSPSENGRRMAVPFWACFHSSDRGSDKQGNVLP